MESTSTFQNLKRGFSLYGSESKDLISLSLSPQRYFLTILNKTRLSVFADGGFHSSEKTSTLNPPPINYNDWRWSNFSEIEQYGNFSAKELGDIVNKAEFSMEFLLTGSWELHILRIFDEFTTDYKENFIDSKSSL